MAGGGAARSEWNQALLSKVVAPCYARLVIACAGKLGPSPAFYALLPETNPPEPWGCVVRELYSALTEGDAKVLHTPAMGGGGSRRRTPSTPTRPSLPTIYYATHSSPRV